MVAAQTIRSEAVNTGALFRSHAPFVARMLGRLGVGADELDDAVQEVFLVVHRNGGYLPGPATPVGYLASIAVRVAASRRRRGRKSRERASSVMPDDLFSSASDPGRSCEAREELAAVQGALDRLDPDLRTTLVLAELEGESCKDIAAMMRIPVGTVYWRLHRARKMFRTALQPAAPGDATRAEALLSEASANEALRRARAQPLAVFDVMAGLARLRTELPLAGKAPLWALGLARTAGWMGSVGIASPAVLSVAATVALLPGTPGGSSQRAGLGAAAPRQTLASLVMPAPIAAPARAVDLALAEPVVAASPPVPMPVASAPPRAVPSAPVRGVGATVASAPVAPSTRSPADGAGGPRAEADDGLQEIQRVAAAEQLLATDPARALAIVRQGEATFAGGYLAEERRYIATVALFALGRAPEARVQAASFLHDYPDGPFTARVRTVSERAVPAGAAPPRSDR